MSTITTLKKPTGFVCALAAAFALSFVAFAPQEEPAAATDVIDFDQRPAAGLKLTVKKKMTVKTEGTFGTSQGEMPINQEMAEEEAFVQKFTEVKDNKVTKVERTYEDNMMKSKVEMEVMGEPVEQEQEQENDLAWKSIRANLSGDEIELELKDGDEWTEASDKVKKQLTRRRLESPLMPLPKGEKRVGESWEVSGKELKEYFRGATTDDESGEDTPIDGTGTFELTEIKDVAGLSCGVIKFKIALNIELPQGQGAKADMTVNGTALYSLKFRTYVDLKMKGTMQIEGEIEQMGQTVTLNLKGDMTQKVTVKAEMDQ